MMIRLCIDCFCLVGMIISIRGPFEEHVVQTLINKVKQTLKALVDMNL